MTSGGHDDERRGVLLSKDSYVSIALAITLLTAAVWASNDRSRCWAAIDRLNEITSQLRGEQDQLRGELATIKGEMYRRTSRADATAGGP